VKVKIPKRVQTRKDLPRFGDAVAGEQNVTLLSKEFIAMEHPDDALIEDKDTGLAATLREFIQRQSERNLANESGIMDLDQVGDSIHFGAPVDEDPNKPKKYVAPGTSSAAASGLTGSSMAMSGLAFAFVEKDTTIRVSNLTKSVTDGDLRDLFEPFGRIARMALPHTERTHVVKVSEGGKTVEKVVTVKEPRGYAYITYMRSEDAEVAFEKLQGYGYDHLILRLEWSKPMERNEGGGGVGGGLSGGFVSGYGQKLAQDTKEKIHGFSSEIVWKK